MKWQVTLQCLPALVPRPFLATSTCVAHFFSDSCISLYSSFLFRCLHFLVSDMSFASAREPEEETAHSGTGSGPSRKRRPPHRTASASEDRDQPPRVEDTTPCQPRSCPPLGRLYYLGLPGRHISGRVCLDDGRGLQVNGLTGMICTLNPCSHINKRCYYKSSPLESRSGTRRPHLGCEE